MILPAVAESLPAPYLELAKSWGRSLRSAHRSPNTLKVYLGAAAELGAFLARQGMPTDVGAITREHVEEYITEQLTLRSPQTAATRFSALKRFFGWLLEEGELRPEHHAADGSRGTPRSRSAARKMKKSQGPRLCLVRARSAHTGWSRGASTRDSGPERRSGRVYPTGCRRRQPVLPGRA